MSMNLGERGLYRELLDHCWEAGSLPLDYRSLPTRSSANNSSTIGRKQYDDSLLVKIATCDVREFRKYWPKVREQFYEKDGRLWHRKVDEKRADIEKWKEERRESGRKGADRRWHSSANGSANAQPLASDSGVLCPSPTPTPTPTTSLPSDSVETSSNTHTRSFSARASVLAADMNGQSSQRGGEFVALYPDKSDQASTARMFMSVVTKANEDAVFACLHRYLASDRVFRGVLLPGWKWLRQQSDNGWNGQWSPPMAIQPKRSLTPTEQLIAEAKQRAKRTN